MCKTEIKASLLRFCLTLTKAVTETKHKSAAGCANKFLQLMLSQIGHMLGNSCKVGVGV